MSERNIGLEILEGVREIKAFKEGKVNLVTRELSEPSHPKEIRARLNLSQSAFAGRICLAFKKQRAKDVEYLESIVVPPDNLGLAVSVGDK